MSEHIRIRVKCGDQLKIMRLALQSFDDFQENIRRRFDLGAEKMSVKAILDGDKREYDVTNNYDLQDLGEDLVEMRITTNQMQMIERLELQRVEIDGVQYRIDVPVAEDSRIVKDCIEQHHLSDIITHTKGMAAEVGLSYVASVASGNRELIDGMGEICFSVKEICDETRLLMSGYERTSSHIINTIQHMILYLFQNQPKLAMDTYVTVKEFVTQSSKDTSKLIKDINNTIKQLTEFTHNIAGVETKVQEELKEVTDAAKEKVLLQKKKGTEIEKAIADTNTRDGAFGLAGSAIGIGLLISPPSFLLVGVYGSIAFGVRVLQLKNQQAGDKLRGEQIEVEEIERTCHEQLRRSVEPKNALISYLQAAGQYVTNYKYALQRLKTGWKEMKATCDDIEKAYQQIKSPPDTEDCPKAYELKGFKVQVVHCYARWVALKVFARQCNESLKASEKTLEDARHITRGEAEARLEAAKDENSFSSLTSSIVRIRKR